MIRIEERVDGDRHDQRRAETVPPEQGKGCEAGGPVGEELERVDLVVEDLLYTRHAIACNGLSMRAALRSPSRR
jgi:hypothetical protein